MTYLEAVDWLYAAVPNFQRDGGSKNYKIGLEGPQSLWEHLDFPAAQIPMVHIAGTNGKGSSTHMMAAGLTAMGKRVGTFTSPHLFSFRERAKIGANLVPESFVAQWVETHKTAFEKGGYSFFELTLMLALSWFEKEQVEYIVLETGMGGRLDATNICSPELCLITNIGLDHKEWLGSTRPLIAKEKAGIIKTGVPVVVVERDAETEAVFIEQAKDSGAPLFWAEPTTYETDLSGKYQRTNISGVVSALRLLFPEYESMWSLGLQKVTELTGFFGRWSTISREPRVVCDTGHNTHAFELLVQQALAECEGKLHWVLGTANDKDSQGILSLLPKNSSFYWTSCSSPRGKDSRVLAKEAEELGLRGMSFASVMLALEAAKSNAAAEDLIFVGGSTFVVADLKL